MSGPGAAPDETEVYRQEMIRQYQMDPKYEPGQHYDERLELPTPYHKWYHQGKLNWSEENPVTDEAFVPKWVDFGVLALLGIVVLAYFLTRGKL